jgi:hypothetical protein
MSGFRVVNAARRSAVEHLSAVTGSRSVEHAGLDPVAQDLGQLGVKLGERRAEGALARWVGAAAEVTGDGERGVAEEISDAEGIGHFAVRLLSRSTWSFPPVEGRLICLPGVQG